MSSDSWSSWNAVDLNAHASNVYDLSVSGSPRANCVDLTAFENSHFLCANSESRSVGCCIDLNQDNYIPSLSGSGQC